MDLIVVSVCVRELSTGAGALRTAKTKKFDIKSSFDRMKKYCPDLKRSRSKESRKNVKKKLRSLESIVNSFFEFSNLRSN